MTTIGELWANFEAHVMPTDAGEVQRIEMRRAFYGGAHTVLERLLEIGCDDVTEDDGVEQLEAMRNEIDVFFVKLGTGKKGY